MGGMFGGDKAEWTDRAMAENDFAAFIQDGEKYALVGLNGPLKPHIPSGKVGAKLWVRTDAQFKVPENWRALLGSYRTSEVENCNLFLISKEASSALDVLNEENEILRQRVWEFYVGLLLASRFATTQHPVTFTGSRRGGEIDIRRQEDLERAIPSIIPPGFPAIAYDEVQCAARLAENIEKLATARIRGGHWRLFRTLEVYVKARANASLIDRIHQYCRCIEGMILPDPGKTKQQFKSRSELFIESGHHDLMGALYDIRSAVEHLHESKYLENCDRNERLELARKEAIAEYIARNILARVIGHKALWKHFANTSALKKFWTLPKEDRRAIWGNPIDPLEPVAAFNPEDIPNRMLGL